jgi:hypothetical protein
MRKTSVVLALFVSSVLLLQAPAWAPKLYRIQQTNRQSHSATFAGRNAVTVKATSDCISKDATLTFEWGETTKKVKTSSSGTFTVKLAKIPRNHGVVTTADFTTGTCNGGVLAFTGSSTVHLLVLGVILVAGGVLLVVISRRQHLTVRGHG